VLSRAHHVLFGPGRHAQRPLRLRRGQVVAGPRRLGPDPLSLGPRPPRVDLGQSQRRIGALDGFGSAKDLDTTEGLGTYEVVVNIERGDIWCVSPP